MKQGETLAAGTWTGAAVAGVGAPVALILPSATRFASTAKRLSALAPGHPAQAWLRFVAQLAGSQHESATSGDSPVSPSRADVEQAVEQRAAPLSGSRNALDPSWQRSLQEILNYLHDHAIPDEARATLESLRGQPKPVLDALAAAFLEGEVAVPHIAQTFYVAAALQVHFNRLAAQLPVEALRLLPQRGLCPCCGSTPLVGVVTASGRAPGVRYLHCSLCSTAWNHVRAVCIHCGEAGKLAQESIEGDTGLAKAETCGHCGTYSKLLDERVDPGLDPVADDLASLGLDMLVGEAGWSRHAPNPLVLVA